MNFISLAVSTFISFYFIIFIIRILPIKRKKLWQGILISFGAISSIFGYIAIFITNLQVGFNLYLLLEILGSSLGVIIAYVAAMMIVLDGISLFKSKRYREFERGINQKDGASIPKNIFSIISFIISAILLTYIIFSIINYNSNILISLIGTIIGLIIFTILGIYFYISGKPLHQTLKSSNLLLYIKLPNEELVYEQTLSKDLTIEQALGEFGNVYMLDEFGLIITPSIKYVVKGVMITKLNKELLKGLNMKKLDPNPYQSILPNFQKYNRKKIVLDELNNIKSITILK